jgi:integrase/recombinase XerD
VTSPTKTKAAARRSSGANRSCRSGIPLDLVQKSLGHAKLTMTDIYATAVGVEEKDIAKRMWG